jgi:hypothetical protein
MAIFQVIKINTHYMKKFYPILFALFLLQTTSLFGQRYLNEVFTNVTKTPNIVYSNNISVLTGAPSPIDLRFDLYEPTGDTEATRPLVLYFHTGSFLPILRNQTATGDRADSATAEMCRQFARRGYVAASVDYRLGWNPLGTTQDIRTGTLLLAVYRAIQDARACVRYFKKSYSIDGNPYKIDTNRIILCGQGSGGYIAMAYATLDKTQEIQLLKFLAGETNATYGFVQGQPYVNQQVWGDYDGFNATTGFGVSNHPGYSGRVRMAINMGGALGDSTWLEQGDVPLVAFHSVNDPFAPFGVGNVIVPTTGQFVVDVIGSQAIIKRSKNFGNQDVFNIPYNDPYTTRANSINNGLEGLFPFELPNPGPPLNGQAGPWEWISYTDLQAIAPFYGVTSGGVDTIYQSAFFSNPNVNNKVKALAYIDTIQGYLAPRIVQVLQLPGYYTGFSTLTSGDFTVTVAPNPASDRVNIQVDAAIRINSIELFDISGRRLTAISQLNNNLASLNTSSLSKGMYLVRIQSDKGVISTRFIKD